MPNILTNLRIDEISSVDHAANRGARILLMKRDTGRLTPIIEDDDIIENDDDPATIPGKMEQFAAILMLATPSLSREDAIYYLTHHAQGQATARYLAEVMKQFTTTAKEEPIMSKSETLVEFIAKGGSMSAVCKHIIEKGSTAVTEHEFAAMLTEHAKLTKRAGETDAMAFSRIFTDIDNGNIRKAYAITKEQ